MNSKSNSGDLMSKKTDGNDGDSSAVPIKQTGRTGDSSPKLSPASSATTVLPPPYQSSRAAKPVTLPPNLSSEVLAVDTVDDHGRKSTTAAIHFRMQTSSSPISTPRALSFPSPTKTSSSLIFNSDKDLKLSHLYLTQPRALSSPGLELSLLHLTQPRALSTPSLEFSLPLRFGFQASLRLWKVQMLYPSL
ncbi:Uncharacterized protein Rs2_28655 [Raphanus sativus]|nr:Uncharacterized protein Rs2_28655 [Raphanus sativus]